MPIGLWIAFVGLVLVFLLVDLGVFHRRAHAISIREAIRWTVVWIVAALGFTVGVYYLYNCRWRGIESSLTGRQAVAQFLSAYVLEKCLSLDNLFVMALVFSYFSVPSRYQYRVLFWGILGVLILRGALIAAGAVLFGWFTWANYLFGVVLIISAFKMLRSGTEQVDPSTSLLVHLVRQLYPVTRDYEGGRFFSQVGSQPAITPLFVVLLVIEGTDAVFALDSIPAAFGVCQDAFLVFTSNIFAVLGLRSLYFVLAGIVKQFRHLKISLFLVLVYVGLKMLLVHYYHIDVVVSLVVILGILAVGILASTAEPRPETEELEPSAQEGGVASGEQLPPMRSVPVVEKPAIQAVQVTKFYGRHRGITDLSLTIPRGALVGLLGPNGAGKTTAIRILSCHMPPTTGTVRVCGLDVFSRSMEVRKRLGYLPENCPLYPEMRVLEYLRWTAQMKGIAGSEVDRAVFHILEACNIDHVRRQTIGTLSKGYRQRVGLAAALIHKPEVVILDEPTIGLDPLQAREFRSLIGSLKGKHTILISSHILSEVDALCDSVVILNEGSVVAAGSPQELRANVAPQYTIECRTDPSLKVLIPRLVHGIAGLTLENYEEDDAFVRFRLSGDGGDPRLEIFRAFAGAGIELREMTRQHVTLEDVFLYYTRTAPEPAAITEATS